MLALRLIGAAQAIDNTLSFRNINGDHYFRINYENDFFTGTDRDYTQGIYLEWVNASFCHFPLMKLLWKPGHSSRVGTGLGLSLSYDIVKAHGGDIKVETKEGAGSEFVVQLLAS